MKLSVGLILLLFIFTMPALIAQNDYPFPPLSPKGTLSQVVGNTLIQVEYERPAVRKREIFGGLVPWNKLWRTGAGHCTKVSFDKNVNIAGQDIPAGSYALFSIPGPDEWVLILNKDTSLYGTYGYDYMKDLARFVVIPRTSDRFYESLTIDIEPIPNNALLVISWAQTQVAFEIETTTDQEIEALIEEELLTGKSSESDIYAGAAEYYLYQGTNLMRAISLSNKALELDAHNGWARNLKIRSYERLKLYEEALAEIQVTIELTQQAQYEDEAHRQRDLKALEAQYQGIKNKQP